MAEINVSMKIVLFFFFLVFIAKLLCLKYSVTTVSVLDAVLSVVPCLRRGHW